MPTYTNSSSTSKQIKNADGQSVIVSPNGSVETHQILGTGWTKTADTPYANPILAHDVLTFTGAQTISHSIDSSAKSVEVFNRTSSTGNVSVYWQSQSNLPVFALLLPGRSVEADIKGEADTLIFVSTNNAVIEVRLTKKR